MYWLILIFILVPATEIAIFIWTGSKIGALPVALLIIFTGMVGVALVRKQGLETWRRAQFAIHNREVPREQILDGICIIAGGIFLLTPGFITDLLGFLLVLPMTRKPFKTFLGFLIMKRIANGKIPFRRW
ncbi:FxsA family protein [Pseudogracilibacillus auburnensis]|uniref:UPF0716 protein FxsA n=1 Tax=Pseudogracilibacillus auburnensis TaxID=1494959 RepID=A0A2V3VTT3_9BACI|nr:FxsA family protein [Pseudogracilibacillus auburnensis]PXW85297.1 UPF0716 protein FxsA [Pseudogracilibacillus auburnensis]